ncbi:MAG: VUT family protein [Spirochaetia bacterium]|nr:VUT family protein [Spirochaetia bacterium]
MVLFALYITSMVLVNTLGSKITTLGSVRASVGVFFVPILFLVTDIIGEVYGRKTSALVVNISTGMLVFMFLMMGLCIVLPPNATWGLQESYVAIFSSSMRMTVASLISFYIAQHIDVFTFSFIKKITNNKYLWIRNNVSTMVSQLFDTTIFMFIAFYHITPKYTPSFIFSLILPYWAFKVLFAFLDTPLCYLGVYWLKKDASKKEVTGI